MKGEWISGAFPRKYTCKSELHPQNAPHPTRVTLDGIVTDVNLLHPQNAPLPMLVTPSGIATDINPLQPPNA